MCLVHVDLTFFFIATWYQKRHFEHTLYMKLNYNSYIIVVCLDMDDLIFIINF